MFDLPLQFVSVLVIIAILALTRKWTLHDTTRMLWALPVSVWLAHGLIFYLVVMYYSITGYAQPFPFTTWSAILRLQAYFTILFIIATLVRLNGKVDHHDC